MVWYFIGVYIINRTLHDRLENRLPIYLATFVLKSYIAFFDEA